MNNNDNNDFFDVDSTYVDEKIIDVEPKNYEDYEDYDDSVYYNTINSFSSFASRERMNYEDMNYRQYSDNSDRNSLDNLDSKLTGLEKELEDFSKKLMTKKNKSFFWWIQAGAILLKILGVLDVSWVVIFLPVILLFTPLFVLLLALLGLVFKLFKN